MPTKSSLQRLDIVASKQSGITRSKVAKAIKEGRVSVNGEPVKHPGFITTLDSYIVITPEESPLLHDEEATSRPFPKVVHKDEHILVLNKPAGLVVHPGRGNESGTLSDMALRAYPSLRLSSSPKRPGIVHRLDKDTSGLMIIALNQNAERNLIEAIKNREVKRVYKALVVGTPDIDAAAIDAPIGRDPSVRIKQTTLKTGRPAWTLYRVIKKFDRFTLLEVKLETGRTHQIRVHMSAINHPIVGDLLYGGEKVKAAWLKRHFLHASALSFNHPADGRAMSFEVDLPTDLQEALAHLSEIKHGS